uniref:nuclear receptor coactivator 5-like isoform X1 n=2 Tax=Myxine glutinosa TaxID=7769 RepID=UPI00358E6B9A
MARRMGDMDGARLHYLGKGRDDRMGMERGTRSRSKGQQRSSREFDVRERSPIRRMDQDRRPWQESAGLEDIDKLRKMIFHYYRKLLLRRVEGMAADCAVIVTARNIVNYGETIAQMIQEQGLHVDFMFLSSEMGLEQTLNEATRSGIPYAVVITTTHQMHRSCTVNILHGLQEEHRNMPQEEAMLMLSRDFAKHFGEDREQRRIDLSRDAAELTTRALNMDFSRRGQGNPPHLQPLIDLLCNGKSLTIPELDSVADYIQKRREMVIGKPVPTSTLVGSLMGDPEDRFPGAASSLQNRPSGIPVSTSQQGVVTSLFNPNANMYGNMMGRLPDNTNMGDGLMGPVPAPAPVPPPPATVSSRHPSATSINLSNPAVRKALDSLLDSSSQYAGASDPGKSKSLFRY